MKTRNQYILIAFISLILLVLCAPYFRYSPGTAFAQVETEAPITGYCDPTCGTLDENGEVIQCVGNLYQIMCCTESGFDTCKAQTAQATGAILTPTPTPSPTPQGELVRVKIVADGYDPKTFTFTSTGPINELNIEGHVVDENGDEIPGASITELESGLSATADQNGFFNISASDTNKGTPFSVSQDFVLLINVEFTGEIQEKDPNGNPYTGIVADGVSVLTTSLKRT